MRTQMLVRPSSNLLQGTGGDHRGGRAQLGRSKFMMTCLCWILGYMRLAIWCKIGLSADWCLCTVLRTRSGACYYRIGCKLSVLEGTVCIVSCRCGQSMQWVWWWNTAACCCTEPRCRHCQSPARQCRVSICRRLQWQTTAWYNSSLSQPCLQTCCMNVALFYRS